MIDLLLIYLSTLDGRLLAFTNPTVYWSIAYTPLYFTIYCTVKYL